MLANSCSRSYSIRPSKAMFNYLDYNNFELGAYGSGVRENPPIMGLIARAAGSLQSGI